MNRRGFFGMLTAVMLAPLAARKRPLTIHDPEYWYEFGKWVVAEQKAGRLPRVTSDGERWWVWFRKTPNY